VRKLKAILKKLLVALAVTIVLALVAVGAAGYFLTRPLAVDFAERPNSVEAQEANRKLKLINQAQTSGKQGFVRFSEVEINSFLDGKYKGAATNAPLQLVKAGVFLGEGKITFVTWHNATVFGYNLPFVWQRVVKPVKTTNSWNFEVASMRVGQVEIPEGHWAKIEKILGATDSLFDERKGWLKSLPMVTLAKNEQSESPEVRLYTYLPKENSIVHETTSE
jgi:hypothetical protein